MSTKNQNEKLLEFAFWGDVERMESHINFYKNMDLNTLDEKGRTALIIATLHENRSMVALLMVHGADIEVQDIYGKTAIMYAELFGYKEVLTFLQDSNIQTPHQSDATQIFHKPY